MTNKKTAVFLILSAILFLSVFLGQPVKAQQTGCALAGQEGDHFGRACCSGLTGVGVNVAPVNGKCLSAEGYPSYGTQFLCIKIGDGVCGAGENKCTSPQDCPSGQQAPVAECRTSLDCEQILCACAEGSNCRCPISKCINGKCQEIMPSAPAQTSTPVLTVVSTPLPNFICANNDCSIIIQNITNYGRLFFLIPVEVVTQITTDAQTGMVISIKKPWWSFLVWCF